MCAPETAQTSSALAACPIHARWIDAPGELAGFKASDDCWIALVAVAGERPAQPALAAIGTLVRNGFTVACWRDGSGWTLQDQCVLLLAGASQVFDAADSAFANLLSTWLNRTLETEARLRSENRHLEQELDALGVVGRSEAFLNVFRWAQKAIPLSGLPVLITGETGTGKELVARAIHRLDPVRSTRPFVPVNCGAINAGLAESELFGHRRGAFTGAERDRKGLVRAALGGVFFLDEIGDLDLIVQAKLLRVLQEHRVLGLGEDQEVAVDVRIVAATNRDLEEMVRQGTFRADLFHRLNVLSVRVPPLRERVEDIEPLVMHFLASCAEKAQRIVSPTAEFLEAMKRIHLPGNVRQLENLVLRAFVASPDDGHIRLNALPPEMWHQLVSTPERSFSHDAPRRVAHGSLDPLAILEAHNWNLERSIDFCEQQIVSAALSVARGNRARAAKLLGISPRGLFNKTRKHRVA